MSKGANWSVSLPLQDLQTIRFTHILACHDKAGLATNVVTTKGSSAATGTALDISGGMPRIARRSSLSRPYLLPDSGTEDWRRTSFAADTPLRPGQADMTSPAYADNCRRQLVTPMHVQALNIAEGWSPSMETPSPGVDQRLETPGRIMSSLRHRISERNMQSVYTNTLATESSPHVTVDTFPQRFRDDANLLDAAKDMPTWIFESSKPDDTPTQGSRRMRQGTEANGQRKKIRRSDADPSKPQLTITGGDFLKKTLEDTETMLIPERTSRHRRHSGKNMCTSSSTCKHVDHIPSYKNRSISMAIYNNRLLCLATQERVTSATKPGTFGRPEVGGPNVPSGGILPRPPPAIY